MTNAKIEFLEHIKDLPKVVSAVIEDIYWNSDNKWSYTWSYTLYPDYTTEEFEQFLSNINRKYDDGYGSQNLGGTIWYEDGTYSDRGEYDGSEWWEYHKAPDMPKRIDEVI